MPHLPRLGLLSICTRRHCSSVLSPGSTACSLARGCAPAKGEWKYYCSIRARVMHKCIDFSPRLLSRRLSRQQAAVQTTISTMLRVTSNGLVTVALCLALTLRFFPRVSSIVVFGWMPLSREGSSIGNREWRSCVTRIIRSRRSIPIEELFRVTGIAKKKNYLKSERREYRGEFTLEFLEILL